MLRDAIINPVIPVADIDRAKRFYADTLKLTPDVDTAEGHAAYRCGKYWFHLTSSVGAGTSQATVLQFFVSDLDAEMADLRSRGVVLEEYDVPEFKTVNGVFDLPEGGRACWFKDSEGNILSLAELEPADLDRLVALTR